MPKLNVLFLRREYPSGPSIIRPKLTRSHGLQMFVFPQTSPVHRNFQAELPIQLQHTSWCFVKCDLQHSKKLIMAGRNDYDKFTSSEWDEIITTRLEDLFFFFSCYQKNPKTSEIRFPYVLN